MDWAHAGRTPGQPDQGIQDRYGNANGPGPSDNCLDGGNCGPPFTGYTAQAVSLGLTYDY
jgi:hypothetical protein